MGGQTSVHAPPEMLVDHHHQYPDMNMIFKGIPKMIQVADDMHRMTNYIMDLRNMTIGLVVISAIGCIGFLILRAAHGSRNAKRRRRSLRTQEEGMMPAYHPGPPYPRFYYPGYQPETWERPKSTFSHQSNQVEMEEKKPLDSRNSPETAKPNGHIGNSTYKSFSQDDAVLPPLTTSADGCLYGEKKPSLLSNSIGPTSDVSAYRAPAGAHKRPLDPVKLVVEDLPYADTT